MRPLHALLLPPGPEFVEHLARALDRGPAILPLNPAAPAAALDRLLARLRPDTVVDADGAHPRADGQPVAADVAVVVATSGSTGTPKGVELSAAALQHSARATLTRLDARPGDRWLCCLPVHHIAGLQVLVRSLLTGAPPEIQPRFDVHALATGGAQFVSLVPTMLFRALETGVDLSHFRGILVGGAAAPLALQQRAAAAGFAVTTTYGMSETCGGAVYDGVALDGVEVAVEPDSGRIRFRGPVLAERYRLDPEATAAAFVDGWFRTRDVAEPGPPGSLRVRGRVDDIVISGGVNVSLPQVAAVLSTHRDVVEAAVYARPDPEWGARIVAVVVPRETIPSLADLRRFVAAGIEPAAAPRELVLVAALPTLPGGKLDRRALSGLTA